MEKTKGYTITFPAAGHKNLKLLALERETTLLQVIFHALDKAYPDWREEKMKNENGLA